MQINCFVFDLGGVCFSNGTNSAIDTYFLRFGIDKQLSAQALCGEDSTLLRTGNITAFEFWNRAKKIMKTNISWQELQDIWDTAYEPNYDVFNLICKLRSRGIRVLFLSDNTKWRTEYLEKKYKIHNYFDGGLFSFLEKTRKPDIQLYTKILALANRPANECVYIDDNWDFLIPAENLGMNTVHFTAYSDLSMFIETMEWDKNI